MASAADVRRYERVTCLGGSPAIIFEKNILDVFGGKEMLGASFHSSTVQ